MNLYMIEFDSMRYRLQLTALILLSVAGVTVMVVWLALMISFLIQEMQG